MRLSSGERFEWVKPIMLSGGDETKRVGLSLGR